MPRLFHIALSLLFLSALVACSTGGQARVTDTLLSPPLDDQVPRDVKFALRSFRGRTEFVTAADLLRQRASATSTVVVFHKTWALPPYNPRGQGYGTGPLFDDTHGSIGGAHLLVILFWDEKRIGLITNADLDIARGHKFALSPAFTLIEYNLDTLGRSAQHEEWLARYKHVQASLEGAVKNRTSVPLWQANESVDASRLTCCTIRHDGSLTTTIRVNPGLDDVIGVDAYGGLPLTRMVAALLNGVKAYPDRED